MSKSLRSLWERILLWEWTFLFVGVGLVILTSLRKRQRMSHDGGIVGTGTVKIVDNPEFPPHPFFKPGWSFRCRLRHAPASFEDNTRTQVFSGSLKFADSSFESPLDLEMNTGRISIFWTVRNFLDFARARQMDDAYGICYRQFYEKYPRGLIAAKDGIRRTPSSFTLMHYYTQTAQRFVGLDGKERYVKFRLLPFDDVPETGIIPAEELEPLTSLDKRWSELVNPRETRSPNYLKHEYTERVAAGTVKYKLQLQLHTPGPEDEALEILNCNKEWEPATHPFMDVAVVEIDKTLSFPDDCWMINSPAHCPPSLALLPSKSLDDFNSINYFRARSTIAKKARIFAYKLFGMPKPQPEQRPRPAATVVSLPVRESSSTSSKSSSRDASGT